MRVLLQLRQFSFRGDKYGDICVRIFPKRQKILIRGAGFGVIALPGVGSSDLEMRDGIIGGFWSPTTTTEIVRF